MVVRLRREKSFMTLLLVFLSIAAIVATLNLSGRNLPASKNSVGSPTSAPSSQMTAPSSSSTVGSIGRVICTVQVGSHPGNLAVDSSNGNVYVGRQSTGGEMMSVISGCSNIGTVNLGSNIDGTGQPGFDSANGNLYVTVCTPPPCNPGNVTVVSTSSNSVVASFPVLAVPNQALYDPVNGYVYVTDRGNGGAGAGLSVIDPSTNKIIKTFSASQVGQAPLGEAYDSATGSIYVADQFYTNDIVYVISGSTNTVVASVQTPASIGAGPCFITYDGQNGDLYVAMCDGHTVSVISGTSNTVVGTISVPGGIAPLDYDSANNNVYVPGGGSGNKVTVISGSTNTIAGNITVGNGPVSTAYDSFNGNVYVSNSLDGTVTVISTASISTISCGHDLTCSVQSDATLSNFKLAGNTIHIEADGPKGALGHATVTVPKSEIPHIETLHVFIDNNKLDSSAVTITSNSIDYFIYFTFTFHSAVQIDIQLSAPEEVPNLILGVGPTMFYEIVGSVVAAIIIAFAAILVRRRGRTRVVGR